MMYIEPKEIAIRELLVDFKDDEEEGVRGYGGLLNIRPKYQREFVYNDKDQAAVIDSIFNAFPLNSMYWVENEDGSYELLDGQQRTLSICYFTLPGAKSRPIHGRLANFGNLTSDERKHFLDYKLHVYICKGGTDSERWDWFNIINIGGKVLTQQELRNAQYPGEWLTAAKRKFSKSSCPAKGLASEYLNGSPIRQDYLETVLRWKADADGIKDKDPVRAYMSLHQADTGADIEWQYFDEVICWVKRVFTVYRKEMKGLEWGLFYNRYKDNYYPATQMEAEVKRLMMDDDIEKNNKKAIYEYLLSGNENVLSIRAFSESMKRTAYERQNGICPRCSRHFTFEEMQGDHITPWSLGGKTVAENCQMLCADCNRRKSNK